MPENRFIGDTARRYDELHASSFDPAVLDPAVDALAALAAGGAVLEFAIGTGRLALPLVERGVPVTGIELSADMIAELRAKPGGDALHVIEGDMATADAPGRYALVVLAFNTLGNLTTRAEQEACFANAARHLVDGGRFVVELGVPTVELVEAGARVFALGDDYVGLDELLDRDAQLFRSRHFRRGPDGRWDESTHPFRFASPAELDEIASAAGLRLEHRWSDWRRTPFTAQSECHVSVWQKPPAS